MVLLIALAHAIPVAVVAFAARSSATVHVVGAGMVVLGLIAGSGAYGVLDASVAGIAWWLMYQFRRAGVEATSGVDADSDVPRFRQSRVERIEQSPSSRSPSLVDGRGVPPGAVARQDANQQRHLRALEAYRRPGATPDERENAVRLWEMAAQEGHKQSQYNIGRICRDGLHRDQDLKAARSWFSRAAYQGHVRAQMALAEVIENSATSPTGRIDAWAWYRVASERYPAAQAELDRLALEMRAEEVRLGDVRAHEIMASVRAHDGNVD